LYVVVKPNRVTLIRARLVVQVHPGSPKIPSVYAVILTLLACHTFVNEAACQKFAKNPGKAI
jgi:hypothetical protein